MLSVRKHTQNLLYNTPNDLPLPGVEKPLLVYTSEYNDE